MTAGPRPLEERDVAAAAWLAHETFSELGEREGIAPPEYTPPFQARAEHRVAHLLSTDPGGAWVTEENGRLTGVALALVRDGIWGLSLYTVAPGQQGKGIGGPLLAATLGYADGTRGAIIVASTDPRALRGYQRAGFTMHPAFAARGIVDRARLPPAPNVRPGGPEDLPLTAAVDRVIRGADHLRDWEPLLDRGDRLLVVDGRGYALVDGDRVIALAALDEAAARELLGAALAGTSPGATVDISELTSAQQWALDVCVEAGMAVSLGGAVCLRGEVGPMTPYLPSGAFL